MNHEWNRLENESDEELIYRICSQKDTIGCWQDVADILNELLHNNYTESAYRKRFQAFENMLEANKSKFIENDNYIKELEKIKFELIKERKKIQAFNNEYYKNAREEGRFELFLEGIKDAVNSLEPIKIKTFKESRKNSLHKTGALFLSDAHYGREVEMKGLFGEIINFYNPKEFERRMWYLLNQMENDLKIMKIDKLVISDCGDAVEGILRLGESLKNLKSGVIDSAIRYAEFMATWIIECYNRLQIPIEYSLTTGNHDIIRILESKANFEEETVAKFIYDHINLRLENSKLKAQLDNGVKPDISLKPYNDVIYHNFYGMNVLTYHGETKNMKTDIEFFENYYCINIDILIGGHLHSGSSDTIGIGYLGDREIIRVPSICGTDNYSKKIRGNSRAGAKYMIFDEDGKNWEKTYFLN